MDEHLPRNGDFRNEGGLMTVSADDPALYHEYQAFIHQNFHHPQLGVVVPGRHFIRGMLILQTPNPRVIMVLF